MNNQRLLESTKLLTSLVNQSRHHQALALFSQMFASPSVLLDPFAFPLALKSSAALALPRFSASIHAHALKSRLLPNPFIASALVNSYGKCSSIAHARQLFDELPHQNPVVWNSMISLYSRAGELLNALHLFDRMDVTPTASSYNSIIAALVDDDPDQAIQFFRQMRVTPNVITVLALLPACAATGALNLIMEIHGFAVWKYIHTHAYLVSGLVKAYGKCGCLVNARRIFDRMEVRDVVVWSSMVSAYAFHGRAEMAVTVFRDMESDKVRPDGIMFLAVLKACSHAGLADDAREYFDVLTKEYGVEAGSDHYSCFVDVLSRAGRLSEAYGVIKGMPVKATAKTWGALLGACRNHGEVELAEVAARELFEMEPENTGNYVLLASIYASAGRFQEAERVRMEMEERGLRRKPGSSWVISKNV